MEETKEGGGRRTEGRNGEERWKEERKEKVTAKQKQNQDGRRAELPSHENNK